MNTLAYGIIVLPKLDNQDEIQQLREKYDPWFYQVQPHIALVPSFTPATLDELEAVTGFLSNIRRNQPPVVVRLYRCVEQGERLFCPVEDGREELLAMHDRICGAAPLSLLTDKEEYEPGLIIGRVPDPDRRIEALHEANRLRGTIGLIDSVSLIAVEASGRLRLVASFPFGIGRVDYFDLTPTAD